MISAPEGAARSSRFYKSFLVNGMPYHEGSVAGELVADAEKLQRALYNVFSNAFKHASSRVSFG